MTVLRGKVVILRPPAVDDLAALAAIRAHPEVSRWWGGSADPTKAVLSDLEDDASVASVIEVDCRVAGWIAWYEDTDPDYRHAGMDLYVDPELRGRGVGPDAVRTLARHLFVEHGHHRIVIDPAVENTAAIRAYEKVGFQRVGVMREYERVDNGTFHDCLLMDLLASDLTD